MSRLEIGILGKLEKMPEADWYTPEIASTRTVCVRLHTAGFLERNANSYRLNRSAAVYRQAKDLGLI